MTGDLLTIVEVVVKRPKSTKLSIPRGDVDNYAKGPLDAAKSLLWNDDAQIETLLVEKRWAAPGEEDHVNIHVGEL